MRGMSRDRTCGRRDEIEAALEARVRRRLERNRPCVAVRGAVGDERERQRARAPSPRARGRAGSCAARASGARSTRTRGCPGGDRPSGGRARRPRARSPRRGRCRQAKPKRRPFTRPTPIRRGRAAPASRRAAAADRAREPERPRQHARPASGDEPERGAVVDAVQHLVERAVATEDVQRRRPAGDLARDLGRLAGSARQPELRVPREARRSRRRARPRRRPTPTGSRSEARPSLFTVPGTVKASRVRQCVHRVMA